jgi:hypothetical protein
MRTLKRPMFKIGGKAEVGNDGIMSGLVDREELQEGTIAPFNRFTADTPGSPYFDNQVSMDNLRRFQELGMGNPYRELSGKAGFDSTLDYMLRPAPNSIIKKIVDASPIVQEQKTAEDRTSALAEMRGGVGRNLPPPIVPKIEAAVEVPDGDTSKIEKKDIGSNVVTQKEKNAILKARAEEFEELLNPGARKRVINNALAAASAQFGKSTGNTMQDIANAITAAAGATSEIDKTKQKAAELAIGESIQKGIAKEKYKPGNYEFLVALKETDPETYKELIKTKDTDQDSIISLAKNYTGPTAVPKAIGDLYQLKADSANAKDYGGTLPVTLDKKSKTNIPDFNKMEAGKTYYSYTDGNFYKIGEGGQPEVTSKPNYLK